MKPEVRRLKPAPHPDPLPKGEGMCARCQGQRWVCENHPDRPWEVPGGCSCGAGMPCPDCNRHAALAPGWVSVMSIWDVN